VTATATGTVNDDVNKIMIKLPAPTTLILSITSLYAVMTSDNWLTHLVPCLIWTDEEMKLSKVGPLWPEHWADWF